MKGIRRLAIIATLGTYLLGHVPDIQSQEIPSGHCRYFPSTGHYVCDRFLEVFETRGGLKIFGYPRTEAFRDPAHSNLWVQYFQRARLEEHPYNAPPYDVQLGLLVDELGSDYPPAHPEELPAPGDPSHHYFPETEHVVSYAFLDFFRHQGGLDIFGYPRSEMVYEQGRIVQYFQRARMEWHRSNPPGQQIILTNVGDWYIERLPVPMEFIRSPPPPPRVETTAVAADGRLDRAFLPLILCNGFGRMALPSTPPPGPAAPGPTAPSANVTVLNASASVRYPITGRTGTQTVFVYVNDQAGGPVAGAEVNLTVHYQSGDVVCAARPTDGSGATRCSFEIPSPPVGKRVVVDITVVYQGLTATTQTFFMPWW